MTLSSVVRMVRLRWRTFVTVVVVCAVAGFVVALLAPNRYISSVQLLVTAKGSSTAQSYQSMEIEATRATSYLALLRSEVVDQRVVDDVDLPYSAQSLSNRINAALVPKTTIIDVQVAGDTADQARAAADSLARQFVAYTNAIEEPTGSDSQRVQTTIVGTATDPVRQRPGAWLFGLLGALVGVVLGVLAAWIRSKTDPIVRTAEDAGSAAGGLPVLGCIGAESSSNSATSSRALRAKLAAIEPASGVWQLIVVVEDVDPVALAIEFARAVASSDRAVVITIEPAESEESPAPSPPVRTINEADGVAPRATDVPITSIDLVRTRPEEPFDAAAEDAFHRVIDEQRARGEAIVIASAAVRLSPAQAAASECANGTILIAVAGSTRRRHIAAVESGLRIAGSSVAGVVLAKSANTDTPGGADRHRPVESNAT